MEKKIIAVAALLLALVLLFVACGKGPTIVTKEGYEYPLVTDEEGNTVVNADGELVVYVTDENGEYVKDANGEPQTNSVTFPDQIIDGKTIETSLYTWTLPEGWSFDDDGKAVKDGSDGNVYVKLITVNTTGTVTLDEYVEGNYNENLEQIKEVQKTYPDASVTTGDVEFSAAKIAGKNVVVQVKNDSGTVLHYVDGIYFTFGGTLYKLEYACLNSSYDQTVDLYTMLQTFTMKS